MALGVLTCLLFLVAVRVKVIGNTITVHEWDLSIVSVNDYSVDLPIDYAGYKDWLNRAYHRPGGDYSKNISPGLSLKRYIIRKVEKELTKELKLQQENQSEDSGRITNLFFKRDTLVNVELDKIKVADLTFCNKNGHMIDLLKKRGVAIAEQEFEEMHGYEHKINEYIAKNYDALITPSMVVITFEEEEGP